MLRITVPPIELYDPIQEVFIDYDEITIDLEHSLVAISKWESKWLKPFLSSIDKTSDEINDYILCMITSDVEVDLIRIKMLPQHIIDEITNYIKSPMTATTINNKNSKASREIITSELIYYWMISRTIPFECQYWHLNRLLMLINVCDIKSSPPKKENSRDVLARNRALNAARKKALNTSG